MQLLLQRGELAGDALELGVGQHADLAVLERHRVGTVLLEGRPVQPEQLARQLEAGQLLAALVMGHARLERAASHRVQGAEGLSGTVERRAAGDAAAHGDEVVEPAEFVRRDAARHAELVEAAVRAVVPGARSSVVAVGEEAGTDTGGAAE